MRVTTLASSSKGNSILVYTDNTKILVDIGLSVEVITKKLSALKIDPSEITAILLTHEHNDHCKGIGSFIRKFKTPCYIHYGTIPSALKRIGKVDNSLIFPFYETSFVVGDFKITPFPLPHDAHSCFGYNIENENKKISIATDFGYTTSSIIKNLYNSRLVILESNHDEKMLRANTQYSNMLKARILSNHGHLSNAAAAKVVCELAANNVKQVVLAHLSEENNTPELAYSTVCEYLKASNIIPGENIKIDVASARLIGTVFYLK